MKRSCSGPGTRSPGGPSRDRGAVPSRDRLQRRDAYDVVLHPGAREQQEVRLVERPRRLPVEKCTSAEAAGDGHASARDVERILFVPALAHRLGDPRMGASDT